MNSPNDTPPVGEFILFQSEDGHAKVECRFESDTLWLTQAMLTELYGKAKATISEHISNVIEEGELDQDSVVRLFRTTAADGKTYEVQHYSLPMVIAVGYRVRSSRGTQFRRWATQTLEEYLVKGFVMDDERLKNPPVDQSAVPDYFDEMLERIRDIRASERRVYLRVKDIFTMAADYTPADKDTTRFFQIIQNKLHFASTGLTAAELIAQRVDANKPNVGLTSFKNEVVRKTDVTIAKNYLTEPEIAALNRIVNMWLDFAEDQALRRKQVFLQDWQTRLDDFLRFNDRDVLMNAGTLSRKAADEKENLIATQMSVVGSMKQRVRNQTLQHCVRYKMKKPVNKHVKISPIEPGAVLPTLTTSLGQPGKYVGQRLTICQMQGIQ